MVQSFPAIAIDNLVKWQFGSAQKGFFMSASVISVVIAVPPNTQSLDAFREANHQPEMTGCYDIRLMTMEASHRIDISGMTMAADALIAEPDFPIARFS